MQEKIINVYVLFWLYEGKPRFCEFAEDEMNQCLSTAESLRKAQRDGEPISHVTFCSENPNSVGHSGVADVLPGYDWKKRRTQ